MQDLLINVGAAEVRVAVVEDGVLQAFANAITLDREGGQRRGSRIGEILLGRVGKVVGAIQAAFVDIGTERAGFLGAKEARVLAPPTTVEPQIADMVREGQAVLVQIVKDPIGEKGARLSAAVTLAGRMVVLTPFQHGVALSRRIEDEEERGRLTAIGQRLSEEPSDVLIPSAGYILRTNAIGAHYEEVLEEAARLCRRWRQILATRDQARAPARLYNDLGPVERALREMVGPDTARILIDDDGALETARTYIRETMPAMEPRLERFAGDGTLFDAYDLEPDLEALTLPRVPLRCGGWITLETTEALTAVDVNSGSFTRGAGLEDTGLRVNLEAAEEAARQIRLRGIGGVIVVDFIHIADETLGARVVEVLRKALSRDGRPVEIVPLVPFGLVVVTRKRLGEPREQRTGEPCPTCQGLGRIRRPGAVALEGIRRIEAAARSAPGQRIAVRAAPAVVQWLLGQGQTLSEALAAKGAVRVEYQADPAASRESFYVETLPNA